MQDFPKKYKSDYDSLVMRQQKQEKKKMHNAYTTLLYTPYDVSGDSLGHAIYGDVLSGISAHQSIEKMCHAIFVHGNGWSTFVESIKTYNEHKHTLERFGMARASHIIGTSYSQWWRHFVRSSLSRLSTAWFLQKKKVVSYRSIKSQTSLLTEEVRMVPRPTTVHKVRYFVDTKKESLVVSLDRPETLFGDVALAVHPLDRRFKKLVGKKVIVPIINRIIPIIADESIELWDPVGVYRVTPAHDFKGYAIAQRHGLQTDLYAFDHNNIFTDHAMIYAGKNVLEFRDNIVQYLYDIHNLQSSTDEVRNVAYSDVHKDYVYPLLTQQWVLSLDTVMQKVSDIVPDVLWSWDLAQKVLALSSTRDSCIMSTQLTNDFVLPLIQWYNSIVWLADSIAPYKKKKSLCLATVLLSLFHEWLLPKKFSLDQLIDLLFASSGDTTILMQDIVDFAVFVWYVHKEDAQEFLTSVMTTYKNPKEIENVAKFLLDQLDGLDFVHVLDNGDYQFVDKILSQSGYDIDSSLFMHGDMKSVFGALAYINAYPKISTLLYVADGSHDAHFVYQCMCLALLLDIPLPSIQCLGSYDASYDMYLSKQQSSYATYCADAYRYDVALWQQDITKSYLVVSKIWNASRYILQSHKNKSIERETIQSKLSKITPFLSDFDLWIVQKFTDVLTKVYPTPQERLKAILHLVVDDFCIKYLEVSKYQSNEYTPVVLTWCILLSLNMLYPVMPFALFQICQLAGLPSIVYEGTMVLSPVQAQKNYKIHLLMNIVSSLKQLKDSMWLKNHEQVDIFIKASVDMVSFIKTYQQLLDTVLHVHVVQYTSSDYFDSTWYLTDTIIDIVVWLKQAAAYRTSLQQVQILLREKKEYLSHLRALMTMSPSSDKEQKIDELKVEIEKLELEEDKLI